MCWKKGQLERTFITCTRLRSEFQEDFSFLGWQEGSVCAGQQGLVPRRSLGAAGAQAAPRNCPSSGNFNCPARMGDLGASAPRKKSVLGSLPNPFLPFLGQEAGKPSQPLCLSGEDVVASAGIYENCVVGGPGPLKCRAPPALDPRGMSR